MAVLATAGSNDKTRANKQWFFNSRSILAVRRMPIEIDTTEAPTFIRITLHGEWPSLDEQRDARLRLMNTGQLTDKTRALIDFRQLTSTAPYSDVEKIIRSAVKDGSWPLFRAYVVGSAVQFGLVRQMKTLAPPQVELEIFTNEEEAQVWLWRNERR
jgi:hypothetical protein